MGNIKIENVSNGVKLVINDCQVKLSNSDVGSLHYELEQYLLRKEALR